MARLNAGIRFADTTVCEVSDAQAQAVHGPWVAIDAMTFTKP